MLRDEMRRLRDVVAVPYPLSSALPGLAERARSCARLISFAEAVEPPDSGCRITYWRMQRGLRVSKRKDKQGTKD